MTKSQYYPSESDRQYEVFAEVSYLEGIIHRVNIEKVIDLDTEQEIPVHRISKLYCRLVELFYE